MTITLDILLSPAEVEEAIRNYCEVLMVAHRLSGAITDKHTARSVFLTMRDDVGGKATALVRYAEPG